ncbi:MAG: transketolase C-terminal domain-containing protein [Clostridiaceae bacterium]|nr:transketolase C-terminal domain-containing protein [Clostridia bacterium]MDY3871187.1 transketolase C-terminal domain-containing protein [Clostridiaceae bacterium]
MYTVKSVFEKEAREMRAVYCETLQQLARENDRIAVLDADLVGSSGTKPFFNEFPDRAIDCGIQENNMIGVAAGMSAAGMIPFAHSFGPFASRRCVDQIFISCAYAKLNVRIVGSDPGVTAAYNGGTHMPFEDMGTLMSIPQITLLEPTDSVQLRWMIRQLEKEYGVYYIRMLRKNAVGVFEEGSDFELGKIARLKEGADVAIVCSGILVGEALKAAAALEAQGVSAAVLNAFTWKPLDAETLAEYAAKCGCVVTAENHNITGGLGAAVAASLSRTRPVPVEMVGVNDEFGEVGTEDFLRKRFDLTADHIIRAAKAAIARK